MINKILIKEVGRYMKIDLFNYGFVELVEYMGNDDKICNSQRVSTGNNEKEYSKERNERLIKFLIENGHESPFEHVVFTFHIKCPMFVQRQWFRHRIGSFNEISQRYTIMKEEFFVPTNVRINNKHDKQMQEKIDNQELLNTLIEKIEYINKESYKIYQELLDLGIQREQQRMVLPMSLYTEFYWTVNLRSLFNFLSLRLDNHSQYEIREYQKQIYQLVKSIVPITMKYKNFDSLITE